VIDASGLLTPEEIKTINSADGVLNGIAYSPQKQDFLITGKLWPWLFEVQFVSAK
jgi:glutamine cyclotransferase